MVLFLERMLWVNRFQHRDTERRRKRREKSGWMRQAAELFIQNSLLFFLLISVSLC
jgi:hypothetical protein